MPGNKQAGTNEDKPRTKTIEGHPVSVPEPVSFPDTLPMPAPSQPPVGDDDEPKERP